MKVGILTFHRATNYGAVLQAFALKRAIEKKGHSADVVDYRNQKIESLYEYKGFFAQKGLKNKIRFVLRVNEGKRRRIKFDKFRSEFLGLESAVVYTKDNIDLANSVYDTFFVGSDQVCNPGAHDFDKNFYLDFVSDNSKKRSYAASFGVSEISPEFKAETARLLSTFDE